MEPLVLKAEEVAQLLRCSAKTIRDDAEKNWPGFPRAVRVGRLKRWRKEDIAAWIASRVS